MDSSEAQPRATRPGDDRWWLPPVIRLLLLVLALAAAATAIWLALRHVDAPSAQSLISDYGYWGVAIGSFGDSFGLPSSGEVVVLLASGGRRVHLHVQPARGDRRGLGVRSRR